ncbi:GNAT family N-acetyltransferase [Aquibacillus kalidii]|uniref:GNAT family N-acetyltransferase n=1 Tax=Aquibacillus kalidii TaxID=2762597 RepID=UPI001648F3BD|nr:GNAT family N-acetyltransferase [Aquibacillus kalidii]
MEIYKIEKEQAWETRHTVMWPNKEFNYIKLKDDHVGIHFGLFKDDILVSVVSVFVNNKTCQFRKFATLQSMQGKGYGTMLLNYIIDEARNWGVEKIWCNARENKTSFYKKFGLEETKETFIKGGRSYVVMEKSI